MNKLTSRAWPKTRIFPLNFFIASTLLFVLVSTGIVWPMGSFAFEMTSATLTQLTSVALTVIFCLMTTIFGFTLTLTNKKRRTP